jgi:hypothetical protein
VMLQYINITSSVKNSCPGEVSTVHKLMIVQFGHQFLT